MAEVVVSPDCAQLVIDYLVAALSVPVSSRVPKVRPAEFVRVTQTPSAGFSAPGFFTGLVVVEAWAAGQPRALELARVAAAHLTAAEGFTADCNGPGHYPADPDTGTPKAGFTADVYAHGSVLV